MKNPLIIALDTSDKNEAIKIIEETADCVDIFKVGPALFIKEGPKIVKEIIEKGKEVFLDLKLHDIPNTVKLGILSAMEIGASFITIHISGGRNMVREAVKAKENSKVKILGVTVLTSLEKEDLYEIGINLKPEEMVEKLAKIGIEEGLDGLVCSPREIEIIRAISKKTIIVTPGVRLKDEDKKDQKRTLTPSEAIKKGADFLVMGRSILESSDKKYKIKQILEEIKSVKHK